MHVNSLYTDCSDMFYHDIKKELAYTYHFNENICSQNFS